MLPFLRLNELLYAGHAEQMVSRSYAIQKKRFDTLAGLCYQQTFSDIDSCFIFSFEYRFSLSLDAGELRLDVET